MQVLLVKQPVLSTFSSIPDQQLKLEVDIFFRLSRLGQLCFVTWRLMLYFVIIKHSLKHADANRIRKWHVECSWQFQFWNLFRTLVCINSFVLLVCWNHPVTSTQSVGRTDAYLQIKSISNQQIEITQGINHLWFLTCNTRSIFFRFTVL